MPHMSGLKVIVCTSLHLDGDALSRLQDVPLLTKDAISRERIRLLLLDAFGS
jgi:hypothetical protein